MEFAVNDIFLNLLDYVNVIFENELIVYLLAFMIVAALIGMFMKLLRYRI